MIVEAQINSLIEATLNAHRNITSREGIEQSSDNIYAMWHNIGLLLHGNFISTHITLVSTVCVCSYVPIVPALPDGNRMKIALQMEMENIEIREDNKHLGAQKLIMYIYENYIAIITQFTGANASGTPVSIDITLYHNRIKPLLEQSVINFINGIPHDYFSTGSDLFRKVIDFNKNLAGLLYDPSLHFIMSSDGIYTLAGNPSPLPYSGPVYS